MDFEFQNGTGPLDGRSPFAQLSQNAQRLPPSMSAAKTRTYDDEDVEMLDVSELNVGFQGSYNAFNSPSKSRNTQPPSPSKPLPPPPAFNALFSTPRKTQMEIDDSSAGETPKSPEQNRDSDATPEHTNPSNRQTALSRLAVSMPTAAGAQRSSPTKEKPHPVRRDSWMMKVKKLYSPGRGEVPRADQSYAADKRVEKRSKRSNDGRVLRKRRRRSVSSSEGDDDSERPTATSPRKISGNHHNPFPESQTAGREPFWLTKLFTFIGQHPTVPHILSFYAQLAFNIFLLTGCAYLCYCFWSAIQGDVDKKAHEAMADIMAEMTACAEEFTKNKCAKNERMPALETVCEQWNKCMHRDPAQVGRARVSAHTFAEIFNSFVEPISYKAMAFSFILVFGCFAVSNFAFGLFRKTESQDHSFWQTSHYQQAPPPTPQRSFSGPEGGFYAGTPWHQPPRGLEPQPSGAYGQIEGRGSPVRRIQY